MNQINASIITIGDELLIGQTIDTNSAFIAQELNKIGKIAYVINPLYWKSAPAVISPDEINAINANFASIDLDDENLFDFASSNKKFSPNDSMNPINFKSTSDTFEWRMNDDHRKDQASMKKRQQQWN